MSSKETGRRKDDAINLRTPALRYIVHIAGDLARPDYHGHAGSPHGPDSIGIATPVLAAVSPILSGHRSAAPGRAHILGAAVQGPAGRRGPLQGDPAQRDAPFDAGTIPDRGGVDLDLD